MPCRATVAVVGVPTQHNAEMLHLLRVVLVELAILRLAPDIRIEIAGHADTQGSAAANLTLSEARAAAVLAYLVAQGESIDRYMSVGYGDTQPVADNTTDEGRARNRRIVFRAILEEAR